MHEAFKESLNLNFIFLILNKYPIKRFILFVLEEAVVPFLQFFSIWFQGDHFLENTFPDGSWGTGLNGKDWLPEVQSPLLDSPKGGLLLVGYCVLKMKEGINLPPN